MLAQFNNLNDLVDFGREMCQKWHIDPTPANIAPIIGEKEEDMPELLYSARVEAWVMKALSV